LATHPGAEVGLVQRIREQPQEQRTGTDGAFAPLTGPLTRAQNGGAEQRVRDRQRSTDHHRCQ
jgi:hypothetical protein